MSRSIFDMRPEEVELNRRIIRGRITDAVGYALFVALVIVLLASYIYGTPEQFSAEHDLAAEIVNR